MAEFCTVFSSLRNSLNIEHIDRQGKLVKLTLLPDYNINIDAKKYAVIREHPAVKMFLAKGDLVEVAHLNEKIRGKALGLDVVDTALKEEAIVVDQNLVYDTQIKFKPSKDKLTSYHGVTPAIASKMLQAMPGGGWQSKKEFLADPNITKHEIDWGSDNLKPEQVLR